MSGSSIKSDVRPLRAPQPVSLQNWPVRDDGVWAWSTAVLLLALPVWAGNATRSPVFGLICLVALAAATWRLWLPVQFDVHSRGVVQTVLGRSRRIPWNQIAGYRIYTTGILLLPYASSYSANGLFIRWNDQRQELVQTLDFFLSIKNDLSPDSDLRNGSRNNVS